LYNSLYNNKSIVLIIYSNSLYSNSRSIFSKSKILINKKYFKKIINFVFNIYYYSKTWKFYLVKNRNIKGLSYILIYSLIIKIFILSFLNK